MTIFQAVILGIVEGITEFLPVSSTGHMIIVSSLMGISKEEFTQTFTIAVQLGAILSVVILYWKRFFRTINFYFKLLIAFLPAAVIGFVLGDKIDSLLSDVTVVAFALLLGGIFLLFVDKIFTKQEIESIDGSEKPSEEKVPLDAEVKPGKVMSFMNALVVGIFQCIALIPGVSRSAATITGGLSQKMTRTAAAEFSFFLAVPTMFAATVYKLYKFTSEGPGFQQADYAPLIIGNIVAFIVAIFAMRSFVNYLTKHGFAVFGYYRILIGAILLILIYSGVDLAVF